MNYNRSKFHPRARRRGISTFLFVGTLPVLVGVTGLVIDLGNLYTKRAYAQRAADAAALAGCMVADVDPATASGSNDGEVIAEAKAYALKNGYSGGDTIVDPHVGNQLGKVKVTLGRKEDVYFIPVLQVLLGNTPALSNVVSANATAEKIVDTALDLGGDYGTTTGASNPAAFGPYSKHSYGDPYSVLYHDDGTLNTPENVSKNKGDGWDTTSHYNPDGQTYSMNVTDDYLAKYPVVKVQLYDPDGYDSKDGQSLDEIHDDYAGPTKPSMSQAKTKYTIYKVENGALKEIKSVEYGNDQATDAAYLKNQGKDPWVTPDGFKIPLATYGKGEYKIRVKTIDGSSENGYNLRAGPDYTENLTETQWNDRFGDKAGTSPQSTLVPIKADGKLQMNFTRTDHVKVRLGYLPGNVAGKNMTVTKFDTDVGSSKITYSYVPDGSTTSKAAAGENYLTKTNDVWSQDTVAVPADFKGGYWYAEYDAGQNDTSSWSIKYPGVGSGTVRLIQ